MTRLHLAALLTALTLTTTTATGEDTAKENATRTRLYEAMRAAQWNDALAAYGDLEARPTSMVFLAAQAHYQLGHLAQSADALDVVLEEDESHLAALYMLAQVRAKQGRQDDAKTLLCTSASHGQSVLRDIHAGGGHKVFAQLLDDSKFVVRLMRSTGEWATVRSARDPFASPVREGPLGTTAVGIDGRAGTARDLELARRLELQIDALFGDFERLAAAVSPDFDELRGKLGELRSLLDQLADLDLAPVSARLASLRTRFDGVLRTFQPLRLEFYVADGNRHLRAMAASLRAGAFQEAVDRHALLLELCETMAQEEIDVFRRNGEQLRIRGGQLARRARLELRAKALSLVITGIVLAPEPEPNRAVINDRIYDEGDSVIDPQTDALIPDLQIIEIKASAVRFQLADLEFVRALARRP